MMFKYLFSRMRQRKVREQVTYLLTFDNVEVALLGEKSACSGLPTTTWTAGTLMAVCDRKNIYNTTNHITNFCPHLPYLPGDREGHIPAARFLNNSGILSDLNLQFDEDQNPFSLGPCLPFAIAFNKHNINSILTCHKNSSSFWWTVEKDFSNSSECGHAWSFPRNHSEGDWAMLQIVQGKAYYNSIQDKTSDLAIAHSRVTNISLLDWVRQCV